MHHTERAFRWTQDKFYRYANKQDKLLTLKLRARESNKCYTNSISAISDFLSTLNLPTSEDIATLQADIDDLEKKNM